MLDIKVFDNRYILHDAKEENYYHSQIEVDIELVAQKDEKDHQENKENETQNEIHSLVVSLDLGANGADETVQHNQNNHRRIARSGHRNIERHDSPEDDTCDNAE